MVFGSFTCLQLDQRYGVEIYKSPDRSSRNIFPSSCIDLFKKTCCIVETLSAFMGFLQVMDVYETGNLSHDFDMTCNKKRLGSPEKKSDDVSGEADLTEEDLSSAYKQPVSAAKIKMTDPTLEEEEGEDEEDEDEEVDLKSNFGLEEEEDREVVEEDSMTEHSFSTAEDSMSAAEEFIFRCTGSRGVGKSYNCPDCDYVCAAPKDLEKHLVIWHLTRSSIPFFYA